MRTQKSEPNPVGVGPGENGVWLSFRRVDPSKVRRMITALQRERVEITKT